MSKRVVEGTLKAFLTEYSGLMPEDIVSGNPAKIVNALSFSKSDMTSSGWAYVGEAKITVDLGSTKEIVTGQVEALTAKKSKVLADAQNEATKIERQIQQLLAIELDGRVSA